MHLSELRAKLPEPFYAILEQDIAELRPAQEKAIKAGLLDGVSLLVCTPTASGKTLIAELAAAKNIFNRVGKAVYVVPLKALASEKFKEFRRKYPFNVALAIGDNDDPEPGLAHADLIVCTAEKLDSLLRHRVPWVNHLATIIVDEIHLLNDASRGPTVEMPPPQEPA